MPDGSKNVSPLALFSEASGSFQPGAIDFSGAEQLFFGLFASGITSRSPDSRVVLRIGSESVDTISAEPRPGYPGVDLLEAPLPPSLANIGEVAVRRSVNGFFSNAVKLLFVNQAISTRLSGQEAMPLVSKLPLSRTLMGTEGPTRRRSAASGSAY